MQLISESYELMKKVLKLDNEAIGQVFKNWNEGKLQSFLIEITRDIFAFKEQGSDHLLLDDIRDEARSKGTGKWTSQIAMDLELPVTVIDTAVAMRDLSKYKALREQMAASYENVDAIPDINKDEYLASLEQAFLFAMIITYAQGMHISTRPLLSISMNSIYQRSPKYGGVAVSSVLHFWKIFIKLTRQIITSSICYSTAGTGIGERKPKWHTQRD
jgi:6-phosphogluconate dehydrogenase